MKSRPVRSERRPVVSVKRILRTVVTVYILVIILLGFLQRQLLYRPSTSKSLPVAANQQIMQIYPGAQDIEAECADGNVIRGWLLRKQTGVQEPDRPLVIYLHGNARDRSGRGPWYAVLEKAGLDVLAIDYQGYGDSEGQVTEGTLQLSCLAAWQYAKEELKYSHEQLIVGGTSLGGAAAVYLTERKCIDGEPPRCLFVTATFSSMGDVASSLYPWLPVRALLVDRYPSDERAKSITCPVLVMHGDRDTLVRPEFGRKLFESFPMNSGSGIPKKWVNLKDAEHNGLLAIRGTDVEREIRTLMEVTGQAE